MCLFPRFPIIGIVCLFPYLIFRWGYTGGDYGKRCVDYYTTRMSNGHHNYEAITIDPVYAVVSWAIYIFYINMH